MKKNRNLLLLLFILYFLIGKYPQSSFLSEENFINLRQWNYREILILTFFHGSLFPILRKQFSPSLRKTSTSSPSWISKILVSPWDSWFVSQKYAQQPRRAWTKIRTFVTTLGTGTWASNVQDGENVNVLRSPGSHSILHVIKIPSKNTRIRQNKEKVYARITQF